MPRRIAPETVKKIEKLYSDGYNKSEIAERVNVTLRTVQNYTRGQRSESLLSPEAKRALDDFGYFRTRYLGRITLPWHEQAAEKIVELLATLEREYLVMNVPPGAGKSTTLMDVCKWLICRNRTIRILYGSSVQSTASDYSRNIMLDLTRPDPFRASTTDLTHGLAVDAVATLEADYGRFKPANGDRWTKEKFVVAQEAGRTAQNKEATVVAYGYDSGFLGGRYDLSIWDDLVTDKNMRSEDAREKLIRWWENTAETRCEPGGLVVLNGQRLSGDDLYRHVLDMIGVDDLTVLEDDIGPDPDGELPRKYHHIKFPAHNEETCKGPTVEVKGKTVPNPDHALTAAPWPDGCLLDPKRLSWRFLAPIRQGRGESFTTVYQQEDLDPTNSLVKQLWIDGGEADGRSYPGCKNPDRMMWQIPPMTGATTSYVTVDPSPTKNWSIQFWLYHHLTERRFLIAHYRGPLQGPEFIDFDQLTLTHQGILEDWWQRAYTLGHPITNVILEQNAAQRFMLQANAMTTWAQKRNVAVVGHDTYGNKSDPNFGVWMLAPLYERGLIDLPWKGTEALKHVTYLTSELVKWPNGTFEDCVMSQWFGEHNLHKIKTPEGVVYRMPRPSWLQAV